MSTRPFWSLSDSLRLAVLIALGATLVVLGFPFPHPDDGNFMGAALNIGAGGSLENRLIQPIEPYYSYPPFYSVVLGLTLRVLGVSSLSVHIFHLAICGVTAWLLLGIGRRLGKGYGGWLLVLLYIDYVSGFGLRSDALGVFFFVLSVALGLEERFWKVACAPFLAMLAAGTHPPLLALSIPWLLWLVIRRPEARLASVYGLIGVAAVLYLSLSGHVLEFFRTFLGHNQHTRQANTGWLFHEWHEIQNLPKLILLPLVGLIMVGLKVRKRGFSIEDALLLLALLLGGYVCMNSLTGNRLLGFIAVVVVMAAVRQTGWSAGKIVAVSGCSALLFAVSICRPLLQGVACEKPSAAGVRNIRERLESGHPSQVVIDWWSLRYVFDYRPGPSLVYVSYRDRPGSPRTGFGIYPDECWIVSAEAENFYGFHHPDLPPPRLQVIAGKPVGQWIANAGQIGIVMPPSAAPSGR